MDFSKGTSQFKDTGLSFKLSCKQVKLVFQTFKKLRPGIPLTCLHGRMKQERRMRIYAQFCEKNSVLFSTMWLLEDLILIKLSTGLSRPVTRVLKNKKLKINVDRPAGRRVVFDDDNDSDTSTSPTKLANTHTRSDFTKLDKDMVNQRDTKQREMMNEVDKEDKTLYHQRLREKRIKQKMNLKRRRDENGEGDNEDMNEDDLSGSDKDAATGRVDKKSEDIFP